MLLAIIIATLLFIIYYLLIKGLLFKGLLGISGCLFIYNWLDKFNWAHQGFIFDGIMIPLSIIIPGILLLLTMAFTYSE